MMRSGGSSQRRRRRSQRNRIGPRMLVGHLKPARVYWYRFTRLRGNGSRMARTITAPPANDPRPVNFAFVSCQCVNEGELRNGYHHDDLEDERAAPPKLGNSPVLGLGNSPVLGDDQLGFVLHLGDFIVGSPIFRRGAHAVRPHRLRRRPDSPMEVTPANCALPANGRRLSRRLQDLADPDLQDARARWPFVAMWDDDEFSWQGRQSIVRRGAIPRATAGCKVATNQAWFEYLPAHLKHQRIARHVRCGGSGRKCPDRQVGR